MKYALRRIFLSLLTVFAVITITFFAMHAIPGGPFQAEKALSPEAEAALQEKYGLDKPIIVQYLTYLRDVFIKFDFGPSLKQKGRDTTEIIFDGLAVSARLGIFAALAALIIGVALGALAAVKKNSHTDRVIMVITTALVSMPSFIMGTILLTVFSIRLGWFPASLSAQTGIRGFILPTLTLSLYPLAYITRLTRSSMLDVLGQDYIRTAKAKGVSRFGIVFRHAMKNSLLPIITYFGPMLAYIITGSLVVERIFAVGGVGRDFIGSISNRDYPLIMGTTIVLSVLVIFMNLLSDMLYRLADPRISS
ncbi:MAG: ABC transporter permease [Ruminococcaceae bacterium]|nr:ABC transporter permease [Oscillospiraceae bacterium]